MNVFAPSGSGAAVRLHPLRRGRRRPPHSPRRRRRRSTRSRTGCRRHTRIGFDRIRHRGATDGGDQRKVDEGPAHSHVVSNPIVPEVSATSPSPVTAITTPTLGHLGDPSHGCLGRRQQSQVPGQQLASADRQVYDPRQIRLAQNDGIRAQRDPLPEPREVFDSPRGRLHHDVRAARGRGDGDLALRRVRLARRSDRQGEGGRKDRGDEDGKEANHRGGSIHVRRATDGPPRSVDQRRAGRSGGQRAAGTSFDRPTSPC